MVTGSIPGLSPYKPPVLCQASDEGGDARGGQSLNWGLGLCPSNSSPPSRRRRRGHRKLDKAQAARSSRKGLTGVYFFNGNYDQPVTRRKMAL